MRKRTKAAIIISTAAVAYAAVSIKDAEAHTPNVDAYCDRLEVTASRYEANTKITVIIDGEPQVFTTDSDFSRKFPWEETKPHAWSVVIDNLGDGNMGSEYDHVFNGTSVACIPYDDVPRDATTTIRAFEPAPTTSTTLDLTTVRRSVDVATPVELIPKFTG